MVARAGHIHSGVRKLSFEAALLCPVQLLFFVLNGKHQSFEGCPENSKRIASRYSLALGPALAMRARMLAESAAIAGASPASQVAFQRTKHRSLPSESGRTSTSAQ